MRLKGALIFQPSLRFPLQAAREPQERISHLLLVQSSLPVSAHLSTGDPGEGQARLRGARASGAYGEEGRLLPRLTFSGE